MKTIISRILILPFLFTLLFSCKESLEPEALLYDAQQLTETDPEQALGILNSISDPEQMPEQAYMEYILANVLAKDRTSRDITTDTLIFKAGKYFAEKDDILHAAQAYQLAGNLCFDLEIPEKALESYMQANYFAKRANDDLLAGKSANNIAFLYYQQDIMDSAIVHYNYALEHYDKINNVENQKLQALRFLGISYGEIKDLDNAYKHYSKGLELAKAVGNTYYESNFIHMLGVNARDRGDYVTASRYMHRGINLSENTSDSLRMYVSIAILHNETNHPDSVRYYQNLIDTRLSEITDKYILSSAYGTLSFYYKRIKNYEEALRYSELEKETDRKIQEENKARKLLEAEKKLNIERKQKQIDEAEARSFRYLLLAIFVSLIAIALSVYLILLIRRQNREEIEAMEQDYLIYKNKSENILLLQDSFMESLTELIVIDQKLRLIQREVDPDKTEDDFAEGLIKDEWQVNNKLLIMRVTDYVRKLSFADKLPADLNDDDMLLIALRGYEYSDSEITRIMRISEDELRSRELALEDKFIGAGLSKDEIGIVFSLNRD